MTETVIAGDRIALRAPLIGDAEALFAELTSDPEVTRYLSWPPHRDVEETRGVITGLFNVGIDHTWLITLRDSGELVGQIGYLDTEPPRCPGGLRPGPAVLGPRPGRRGAATARRSP